MYVFQKIVIQINKNNKANQQIIGRIKSSSIYFPKVFFQKTGMKYAFDSRKQNKEVFRSIQPKKLLIFEFPRLIQFLRIIFYLENKQLKLFENYKNIKNLQSIKRLISYCIINLSFLIRIGMQQQHIGFSLDQSTYQESLIDIENHIIQRRKPKRKLSNFFKRVAEKPSQVRKMKNQQMNSNTQSKFKGDRKDTMQTHSSVNERREERGQAAQDQVINELILKSDKDPFLRKKLKIIMENDLKSLAKLNHANPITETPPLSNLPVKSVFEKHNPLYITQIIDSEYKNIPKDISMVLNKTVTLKKSETELTKSENKAPSNERFSKNFTEQDSILMVNNQLSLKQNLTTLRMETYKNKVSRLELLRQFEGKEKTSNQIPTSILTDRTNIQNNGQIRKVLQRPNKSQFKTAEIGLQSKSANKKVL